MKFLPRQLHLPPPGIETFFLWGPRQTGKSTLLGHAYPGAVSVDLLRAEEYRRYVERPELRSKRHGKGAEGGGRHRAEPDGSGHTGVKRHVLTDGRGVPLSVVITGANVHDKWMVGEVLDAVAVRAPRGPRRPMNLCLDKGYDYADCEAAVRSRGIIPHIRRRGELPLVGCVRGKPRRWVVERTNSWHNRFRGLLIRRERIAKNYLAMLQLACGLIVFQQTHGF